MKINMLKTNELSLREGFEKFISKCKVKNLADRTIDYYYKEFERFTKYLKGNPALNEITTEVIEGYTIYLKNETGANEITIASYMRAVRAIFYYLMKMGYMDSFMITIPKAVKKVKETYTDEELKVLLKKPNLSKCSFTEYKTWVYINYLLATGNRISTVINLKIKDLDFDNMLIKLTTTKNKRQQIIPMAQSLKPILVEYLEIRGGNAEDYVFCTETGAQAKIRTMEDNLKYYNHKRGISKTSSHLFRHTFAKTWILNGGDIFRLQKMLGHSDLSVVKEYVSMFSNDLVLDFDKYNPLDKLVKSDKIIKMK